MDQILDKLGRSMYFTTLDLAKGFYQVEVHQDDIAKTAFSCEFGHYEYTRLPMGMKNAPATFQRLMNDALKDYIGRICFCYMDDIIIFSSSLEEHIISLKKIFRRFKELNLMIQLDKCEFLKRETKFLGHIISEQGVKPSPAKVDAIRKFPIPSTAKEIKSFLGLVGFYRKFIKDFAKIAKPMTLCLKRDIKINLNDAEYVNSFEKLKNYL